MISHVLRPDAAVAVGKVAADALAWRHKGELRVTVITKATFAFASDAPMTRVEPLKIAREEVHYGDHPARSIRFTTDLVPHLTRADVLFTGHAHVPTGGRLETLPVRLGIFDGARQVLDKMLLVRQKGGFQRMPIVYERAYGGIGFPDNPLGVGFVEGSGDATILDPTDAKRTAGFGPITRGSARRKRLLGLVPRVKKGEIMEIPEGFDWIGFQCAPADQQIGYLRGDEWIVMDGLHPTLPRARMRLPGARGLARVHGLSPFGLREGHEVELRADILHIDGDDLRCTVTWRGSFVVPQADALAAVRALCGVEISGEPIVWSDPAVTALLQAPRGAATAPFPGEAARAGGNETTLALAEDDLQDKPPTVPFRRESTVEIIARASKAAEVKRGPAKVRVATGTLDPDDPELAAKLAAALRPPEPPAPPETPPQKTRPPTGTLDPDDPELIEKLARALNSPPLPFKPELDGASPPSFPKSPRDPNPFTGTMDAVLDAELIALQRSLPFPGKSEPPAASPAPPAARADSNKPVMAAPEPAPPRASEPKPALLRASAPKPAPRPPAPEVRTPSPPAELKKGLYGIFSKKK
jgi:hypothetical protein